MPTVLSNNPDEDIAPVSPFGAIDYGQTKEDLETLSSQYDSITEITDRASYDVAQKAVTILTRARTAIEKRRKQLKSESLEFGRLVDSTGKELMAVVSPQEDRIKGLIDEIKAKKAAEKAERERIEQERINEIQERMNVYRTLPVEMRGEDSQTILESRNSTESWEITEAAFEEFADQARELKTFVIDELNELYAGALHDEAQAKKEAEERAEQDQLRKEESERLAKERAEMEAKQAEIDRQAEVQRKEIAEQQAQLQAERDSIEAAKRAELEMREAAEKAERERIEAENAAKEKAEQEAKAKADRDRLAKEFEPDRKQLLAYASAIKGVAIPDCTSDYGDSVIGEATDLIGSALELIAEATA